MIHNPAIIMYMHFSLSRLAIQTIHSIVFQFQFQFIFIFPNTFTQGRRQVLTSGGDASPARAYILSLAVVIWNLRPTCRGPGGGGTSGVMSKI